jgi:hypothetical protein
MRNVKGPLALEFVICDLLDKLVAVTALHDPTTDVTKQEIEDAQWHLICGALADARKAQRLVTTPSTVHRLRVVPSAG